MTTAATLLTAALLATAAVAFDASDPAEPWRQARVGLDDTVPAPFTPLTADGTKVGCWGRSYDLALPLPNAVESQGVALLAEPCQLVVKSGGAEQAVTGEVRTTSVAGHRIEFAGSAAGEVPVEVTGWIEYDGCLQTTLTIGRARQAIEACRLEVPLAAEIARFLHLGMQWGDDVYAAIGPAPDWSFQHDWQALCWVGDHQRGLTVVTESPAGWVGPADKAIRLARRGGAVVLTLDLIAEPVTLTEPRRYQVGFQATPGKPLPPTWHGRHVGSALVTADAAQALATLRRDGVNVGLLWTDINQHFSYPEAKDHEALKTLISNYHAAGVRCVSYINLSAVDNDAEVFKRNREAWLMTKAGKPVYGTGERQGAVGYTSVCCNSGYTDWLVWAVDRAMAEYDLDGVYIDNPGPYYCDSQAHGCGRHGLIHPYFANRLLQKRLWHVVHGRKPETGIVWEHNSRTSNSFNLTFCDIYSDGEHFRVKSKGRPEQITRTLLDVSATGRQWGSQPCFLPSTLNIREEYTPWLLARLLPFGNAMMVVAKWMDFSVYQPVLRARLEFGLAERPVTWFTPEKLPAWLKVEPPELLAGGTLRDDGKLLLTVSNLTEDKLAAKIDLTGLKQGLGGEVDARDALTGAPFEPLGKRYVLAVPANDFRLLRFERR